MNKCMTLLRETVEDCGMYPDGWINVCTFCRRAWEHEPDCLWLRIRAFLESQGIALEPLDPSELPQKTSREENT